MQVTVRGVELVMGTRYSDNNNRPKKQCVAGQPFDDVEWMKGERKIPKERMRKKQAASSWQLMC
jgi:hypothetical protein